ncbi:ABC transporter permease [Chloroflexota bacterium]
MPIIIMGAIVFAAIFADLIAPHSPVEGFLTDVLRPPFWMAGGSLEYPLGTDRLGKDIFSRILFGARISLIVSLVAIFIGGSIGTLLGIFAGYFGGWVDNFVMRIVDIFLAMPLILIALIGGAILGPSFHVIIILLSLFIWSRYARQIRGEVLSIKERDFIALARVAGCSNFRIMLVHILPNVTNTLIVVATLQVGMVILLESSLTFLGVGIPPPTPAWGFMVADGRSLLTSAWWISVFPGIAILLTVLSLNLAGDWLRDTLDPKLRQL